MSPCRSGNENGLSQSWRVGSPDPDRAYFELIHPEKMRLSIDYVKNRSVLGDTKIILATIGAALGRRPRETSLRYQDTSIT